MAEEPVVERPNRPSQPPCRVVVVAVVVEEEEEEEEGAGEATLVSRAMRAGVADLLREEEEESLWLVGMEETVRMEAATEEERL